MIKCDEYKIGYLVSAITDEKPLAEYNEILDYLGVGSNGIVEFPLELLKLIYREHVGVKNRANVRDKHFVDCGIYLSNLLNEHDMDKIMGTKSFDRELQDLINVYGIDNDCGVPDYVLADFIVQSLEPLKNLVNTRDKHLHVAEPECTTLTKGGMTQQDLFEEDVLDNKLNRNSKNVK